VGGEAKPNSEKFLLKRPFKLKVFFLLFYIPVKERGYLPNEQFCQDHFFIKGRSQRGNVEKYNEEGKNFFPMGE